MPGVAGYFPFNNLAITWVRGRLQSHRLQIIEHFIGMRGRIDVWVDFGDASVGADQVGDAGRRLGGRAVGRAVGDADGAIFVTEQVERKIELVAKGAVVGRGIETDPQDACIAGREIGGSITEPLAFDGSPRRIGSRIPPQNESLSRELIEADHRAVLIRQ
jgi:hypothetical protein